MVAFTLHYSSIGNNACVTTHNTLSEMCWHACYPLPATQAVHTWPAHEQKPEQVHGSKQPNKDTPAGFTGGGGGGGGGG